ncbi:LamG domain-containing protein [Geodermatophilus aquaeductus]|uniref:Peptidase S24-like n=1 Tax=Geodermatophilus aquaeductus TaxID=1564161 RepID=A0A521FT12_9ACTN|nr:LamG-like jellyroll fold domain-containing protein [Geodermatophilus aquaeductus]SMO99309.1 Peptidase S24-like [Geodermatophilus aquaeductus]
MSARGTWTALLVSTLARGLLATLGGLVLWSVVPVAAGWEATVVGSGSMAPALAVGDVVLARPAGDDLVPGQVLLVDDPDHPGALRLHRLVQVGDDGRLVLRGDANPEVDRTPVDRGAVHGVGALRVPVVGHAAVWVAGHRAAPLAGAGAGLAVVVAAALLYRGPAAEPGPRARWRRPLIAVAAAGTAALVVALVAVPGRAAFAGTTGGDSGGLTSATYFTCGNAARDVGAGGVTGTAVAGRYYALQETGGTAAADTSGTATNGTYRNGVTLGVAGPCPRDGGRAVSLDGVDDHVTTSTGGTAPTVFSYEVWFRTTTTRGGVLVAVATSETGASADVDRVLYMANDGRLLFGLQPTAGTFRTIASTSAYNDGTWHVAVVTMTNAAAAPGSRLYVDGVLVASDATMTAGRAYSGFWRIGWDAMSNDAWPVRPASNWFAGSLASVSTYSALVLTPAQVADHARAGR